MRRSPLILLLAGLVACDSKNGGDVTPGRAQAASVGSLRVGALSVERILGNQADPEFDSAVQPAELVFPRDHGAHERFRSEWWYFTAALEDAAGNRFGTQFTIFRQAVAEPAQPDNPWQTGQIYLGHVAVTDVSAGEHLESERISRGHPALAGSAVDPFGLWLDGWSWKSDTASVLPMQLSARDAEVGLELSLGAEGAKPVVLQGESGFSAKGPDSASYYYSLPRIPVHGRLFIGDRVEDVVGLGWIDREWSTGVLPAGVNGWAWFGLHLDDGSDLMAFQLQRADGTRDRFDSGTWVGADGRVERLVPGTFELQPIRYWNDGESGRWPVEWMISCTVCGEDLMVRADLDDQRMDTLLKYWEGLVSVLNDRGERIGGGYMELTGY